MPKPDQDLLDGHFAGEHEAHADVDHKVGHITCSQTQADIQINILPAGTDPEHPPVHHEKPAHHEPIQMHNTSDIEPHTLNVAPEPLQAPPKASVHLPNEEDKEEVKAKGKQAEKEVKQKGKEAEKEIKKKGEQVEKKGKELADQAEKKGKEYAKKAKVGHVVFRTGCG